MAVKVLVRQNSVLITALRFTSILAFRFFFGRPMDGKKKDNSTFTKGATKGKPGKALTAWQKKPHMHRALIRASVFWPTLFEFVLLMTHRKYALFLLVFSVPALGRMAFLKGRIVFFQPFTSTDAPTGDQSQHWIMRPKWRALIHGKPVPGMMPNSKTLNPGLPPEVERIVRETINAQELKGEMPITRVRRVRQK